MDNWPSEEVDFLDKAFDVVTACRCFMCFVQSRFGGRFYVVLVVYVNM